MATYLADDEDLYPYRLRNPGDPDEEGEAFDTGPVAEVPQVAAMPKPTPELRAIISAGRPSLPSTEAPVVKDAAEARNRYAEAVAAKPEAPTPKWWQRGLAGLAGFGAGWSNAASRTRNPIDIQALSQAITAPGYDRQLAGWKNKVAAADAAQNTAAANEQAWWKSRQLSTEEERRAAEERRNDAMAQYESERNATMERSRKEAANQRLETQMLKPWGDDAQLQKEGEPVPPGMEVTQSLTQPGMVWVHPPRNVPIPAELAPYAAGRKVGDTVPYSEFKRAQAAAQKDTLQQNKPVKPPAESVDRILLNPGDYTPEQVAQARKMFAEMHRPPAAQTDDAKAAIQRTAAALAAGDMSRLRDIASLRGDQRLLIYDMAKQINPAFNTAEVDRKIKMEDYYANGKGANNLQSFGTFLEHAGVASDATNGIRQTNSAVVNKPINWWRKNMAGDPNFQAFATALEPVRKEFEGFLLGGRALYGDDRKEAEIILNENSSPAQIQAALKAMGHTAQARFNEENFRYKKVMGRDLVDPLSQEAIEGARKIGTNMGGGGATATQNPNPNGYVKGHVYGGLTYLGGDPNQPTSWRK